MSRRRIPLLQVVDFLRENHDVMYVLPGMDGALIYDPMIDEVTVVWGDFHGTDAENSAEMEIALQRSHAWMN
jgi:hypothetical protein